MLVKLLCGRRVLTFTDFSVVAMIVCLKRSEVCYDDGDTALVLLYSESSIFAHTVL